MNEIGGFPIPILEVSQLVEWIGGIKEINIEGRQVEKKHIYIYMRIYMAMNSAFGFLYRCDLDLFLSI